MARTSTIPFWALGTVVGMGGATWIYGQQFDLAGNTRLTIDCRKYGETGGGANLGVTLEFSQDGVTFDESSVVNPNAVTTILSPAILRFARATFACDVGEVVMFKVIARAMDIA